MGIMDNNIDHMTQGHLRNVQQLAVFYTGHNKIFAINISKIKAFIITSEITINDTPRDTNIITGIATIRKEPVTIINLDMWLGEEYLSIDEYKLIIYCEYNNKKIGFLVKEMIDIIEKQNQDLSHTLEENSKITYTTYVNIKDKNELCAIFNAEQLLKDINLPLSNANDIENYTNKRIISDKLILVAEDSLVSREIIKNFLNKISLKFEIYEDGQQLINRLNEIDINKVGLIITDIEMPIVDGYQLVNYIKSNKKLSFLPIIANSSMTLHGVNEKMQQLGVNAFVGKTQIETLYNYIKEFLLK